MSASLFVILGQFLMAMVILAHPDITYHSWQGFIIYQVLNVGCTVINIYGQKWLPVLHSTSFFVFILAFFMVNLTLLGTAFPKNSAAFVFNTFTNNTGWKSSSIAFIVGLTNPAFAFGGIDGAIHMAEEMKGTEFSMRNCRDCC